MKKLTKAKTKLVCTLGPASSSPDILKKMIKAGMNVARINFSHGDYETYKKTIKLVRDISKELNIPVAILQDLRGPKLRVGKIKNNSILLKKGDFFTITTKEIEGTENIVSTDFKNLPKYVKKGETILMDDGNLELKVSDVKKDKIISKIIVGGILKSNKGINLPNTNLNIPALTEKDRRDVRFGVENRVDYIALSFVQRAKDIKDLKLLLKGYKTDIPVISKIEKPSAMQNLDEIIDVSDGVMVARGDLGVEMKEEMIPILQKEILRKATKKGKITITATQMLESMIEKPRPTRAEATDVSNAILDLTDAVMLSAETAVGKYPVVAVRTIKEIANITENSVYFNPNLKVDVKSSHEITESIVKSAFTVAETLNVKAITVFTWSGTTALMLSKHKPKVPIYAFTPEKEVLKKMALYWGVTPMLIEYSPNTDILLAEGEDILLKKKLIKTGDTIVMIGGVTPIKGATNMLRIVKI
jgi:pyruvate kinase